MADTQFEITDEMIAEVPVREEHPEWMKGTAVARELNAQLTARDLPTIRSQMIYNYMNKGYLPNTDLRVHRDDAVKFITEQLARRIQKNNS
jgi:hypothetical protein